MIELFDNKEFGLDVQRYYFRILWKGFYQLEEFDKISQELLKIKTLILKNIKNIIIKFLILNPSTCLVK